MMADRRRLRPVLADAALVAGLGLGLVLAQWLSVRLATSFAIVLFVALPSGYVYRWAAAIEARVPLPSPPARDLGPFLPGGVVFAALGIGLQFTVQWTLGVAVLVTGVALVAASRAQRVPAPG
jgi:hypothetical protein